MTNRFKALSIAELMALPPTDEVADLLREAASFIDVKNLESATWRMADAWLLLRRRLVKRRYRDVEGFDTPTGRGALLGGGEIDSAAR